MSSGEIPETSGAGERGQEQKPSLLPVEYDEALAPRSGTLFQVLLAKNFRIAWKHWRLFGLLASFVFSGALLIAIYAFIKYSTRDSNPQSAAIHAWCHAGKCPVANLRCSGENSTESCH
jgi:hypothetical protein